MNHEFENVRDYSLKMLNVSRLNQTEENRKNMVETRNIIIVKPGHGELIRHIFSI